jgi:hypothetical protein
MEVFCSIPFAWSLDRDSKIKKGKTMAKKVLAVVFGFVLAPAFISAADGGLTGSFGSQVAGEPCAVRVYHTNFVFPNEGGKIIQVGPELYFVRTYIPGCANAGGYFPTVVQSPTSFNPLQLGSQSTYVNPAYVSGYQQYAQPTTAFVQPVQTRPSCY